MTLDLRIAIAVMIAMMIAIVIGWIIFLIRREKTFDRTNIPNDLVSYEDGENFGLPDDMPDIDYD